MSTKAPQRLLFVDVLRGLAVLYMIQLHTSHGWLLPEARSGSYWDAAQFFGGLAAPLFLLLAGAGLGLQWTRQPQPGAPAGERSEAETAGSLARGVQLVVLGYVLRLQMWIIDGGAYARLVTYPSILLLALGYALAYTGAQRYSRREPSARLAWGASAAVLAGLVWAYTLDRTRAAGLIRVDVLQCIGASLIILSALGAKRELRRPRNYAALALIVALTTPLQQRWVPGPLPDAVAGYLAQWPSASGQRVLALFPLFPWLSYAASGVALGMLWGRARDGATLELVLIRFVVIGACVALVTNPSWPPARLLATYEEPAALLRVLYKTALCCVMIGPALALARAPQLIRAPLALLGRTSLLVYWVHLEFAFGTASRPVANALSTSTWAYTTLLLMTCMWAVAALRNTRHASWIRDFPRRPVTG